MIAARKGAGQQRTRMGLLSSSTVKDTIGGQTAGEFTAFGNGWAAVEEVPFIVNASEHGVLYKLTTTYRGDIVNEFETLKRRVRITIPGKALTLLEIENPDRRNRQLVLHCAVA